MTAPSGACGLFPKLKIPLLSLALIVFCDVTMEHFCNGVFSHALHTSLYSQQKEYKDELYLFSFTSWIFEKFCGVFSGHTAFLLRTTLFVLNYVLRQQ